MAARLVDFIEDLEGKFFQCNICLDVLQDPKQLPCFHRFCQNCLNRVCNVTATDVIKCPACRRSVSTASVKNLKIDYLLKQLIDHCKEKKSTETKNGLRQCYGCISDKWVHLYCFACYAFYCQHCARSHSAEGVAKDHNEFVLHIHNFPELSAQGLDNLESLRSARRCHNHPELLIQSVCTTCQNVGLCVMCMSVSHKGHTLEDLGWVTSGWRKKLKGKVDDMDRKAEEFLRNAEQARKISKNIQDTAVSLLQEIRENATREDLFHTERSLDYEFINIMAREHNLEAQKGSIIAYLQGLDKSQSKRLTQLHEHYTHWKQRYTELKLATDYLISTSNESAFPKAIKAMCDIIDYVIQQGSNYFEDISHATNARLVFSPSKSMDCFGVVHVKASLESRVKLKLVNKGEGYVCSITSSTDGRLFVSVYTDQKSSEIVETAINGTVTQRQEFLGTSKRPRRVVTSLVGSKVVTACYRAEIGIYDTADRSYIKVNLDDLNKGWSPENWVTCLAVDHAREQILVGSVLQNKENRVQGIPTLEVLTFDLEYSHALVLPCPTKGPTDICVVGDRIVICDLWGKSVYAIDMHGRLQYRFLCPRVNNHTCAPRNVCTDLKGYVYILWECNVFDKMHKLIMQSTIEGRPLTLRQVDSDAKSATVARNSNGEMKLVVATYTSKQLHVYNLMDFDTSPDGETI